MDRTCLLCQTKYKYCPYCAEDANKPTWMFLFHDENCQKIFDTLQRHTQEFLNDEEAIKKLKECNLDVLKTASSTVNNQVKKILAKEQIRKPIKKVEVKKEETIEQK